LVQFPVRKSGSSKCPNHFCDSVLILISRYRRVFRQLSNTGAAAGVELKDEQNYISTSPYTFMTWNDTVHLFVIFKNGKMKRND